MSTLDIDQLRAFVLVAELQGFTLAADALGATQSAVSLRIGKLERTLGVRLLARTPRSVALTPEGRLFLESARDILDRHDRALTFFTPGRADRRLRLAMSDHAVGGALPLMLRRLRSLLPGLVPEVEIGLSSAMRDRFAAGAVDAALVRQEAGRSDGQVLYTDDLIWAMAADFVLAPDAPVPLLVLDGPCGVRGAAVRALEGAGRPWRLGFVGGSVPALLAAVQAGLGVAPIGAGHLPDGCVAAFGLPVLPSDAIVLHTRLSDPVRSLLVSALRSAGRPQTGNGN